MTALDTLIRLAAKDAEIARLRAALKDQQELINKLLVEAEERGTEWTEYESYEAFAQPPSEGS